MTSEFILITASEKTGDAKTWIREKLSPRRMISEFLLKDYKEKMDILRSVDDRITAWAAEFEDDVSQMKSAFKAGRYIDLFTLLTNFNRKLLIIENLGKRVKQVQEKALKEFEREKLLKLPPSTPQPLKEAGIKDWARQFVVERFLDQNRKEKRRKLSFLIDRANKTTQLVNRFVDQLHEARAKGNIGEYLDILKKISNEQQSFYKDFYPIYEEHLKPLVEETLAQEKKKKESLPIKDVPQTKIEPALQTPVPDLEFETPKSQPSSLEVAPTENIIPPTEKQSPPSMEEISEDEATTGIYSPPTQRSHALAFFEQLSKETSLQKAAMKILNYAEFLEESDPKTSLQLTQLVSKMI